MSETKVFQNQAAVPEEPTTGITEEIEIPEDSEFGYVVSMSKEGNVYFQTFGGPAGLKKTWLLSGLHQAVSVIIQSNLEKQINTSNAAILGNMLETTKQLVSIMKSVVAPRQKQEELPKE